VSEVTASCPHYKRSCLLKCFGCKQFVACRLCHEEMNQFRFQVELLRCVACGNEQAPADSCAKCGILFATYCCTICHTYDSTPGKLIFHCNDCGICRVGTRDTVRHCRKCNMCIVGQAIDNHSCFENSFQQDCAACLGSLFDSTEECSMLKCGHAMHKTCFRKLLETEYRCPTCKQSVGDMSDVWEDMDAALEQQMETIKDEIPAELLARIVKCLCNDCHHHFELPFNPFFAYKCTKCSGFNTNPI
jgi:RING finger/CHY zinc finger protein 1